MLTVWPGWVCSLPVAASMRNSGVSELPRVACAGTSPALPVTRPLPALNRVSP